MNKQGKKEDLKLYNKDGVCIYEYKQHSNGDWNKWTYNDNGDETSYENSTGYWNKCTYNDNRQITFYENSNGYWIKYTYNNNGQKTSYEDFWYKWTFDNINVTNINNNLNK